MKKWGRIAIGAMVFVLGAAGVGAGTAIGNQVQEAYAADTTVTKTTAELATVHKWVNGTAYTSWALDENVTISTAGTGNNGKYYSTSSGTWRLYQAGSGNLVITVANGYELASTTIVYSVANTGTLVNLPSNTATTISGSSATFSVGNTSTATNGNVQISSFSVTYGVSSVSLTSIAVTQNPTKTAYGIGDTLDLSGLVVTGTAPTAIRPRQT